jgi:molybdopterin converting factor small subunit
MPQIQVNLYATLRKHTGGAGSLEVEIEPGATVAELLDQLGVPADQARVVFIDTRSASFSDPLNGGEQVGIFPAIAGG